MLAIRSLWFDLDDTLYDHTHSVCCGMTAIRGHYPVLTGYTSEELATLYNRALDSVYADYVRGEISFTEMRQRKLRLFYEAADVDGSEAPSPAEFHRIYDEAYRRERRTTPGSKEMLAQLRENGTSLGILTNGKQAIQEDKLRTIGLEWMIPNLLTAERAGSTKPDPGIYEWALRQTGYAARDVLMVGDNLENDVEAALRGGLNAVLYAPRSKKKVASTAYGEAPVIHEWRGLLDVIGRDARGTTR